MIYIITAVFACTEKIAKLIRTVIIRLLCCIDNFHFCNGMYYVVEFAIAVKEHNTDQIELQSVTQVVRDNAFLTPPSHSSFQLTTASFHKKIFKR